MRSRPTVRPQIENIISKTRRRFWILRHLKKFGLLEGDLVDVYKSCVRSVIEFTAVVYHSMLSAELSHELEKLQMQALKCIFGLQHSYRKLLEKTGQETLEDRRVSLCDKFALQCLNNQFSHWFPTREGREGLRLAKNSKKSMPEQID